jgi:hypothetical protein
MKKPLGLALGLTMIGLMPSVGHAAGMIEATCTKSGEKKEMVFDIDTSGGKQEIAGLGKADVKFTKNKIIVKFKGGIAAFNITNGKMFFNGEHEGVICKYDNLAALENKSTPSASSNVKEGELIKLLKSMKSQLDRIEKSLPKF